MTKVENFDLIYPNLNVVCEKLNKHHCVIMPFVSCPKGQQT
jgi:hypothetical protein